MSDQQSVINDQLKAPLQGLPRPDVILDIKPTIKSLEDAEVALRELSWCHAVESAVETKAGELLAEINELAAKAASFLCGEEVVPVADRRKLLEAALLTWGDKNRTTLCPGKKKSVELRNGKFTWRSVKDTVVRDKDVDAKDAKEKICELPVNQVFKIGDMPLAACLRAVVDKLGYHGAITVSVDVNKTAATAAFKDKLLTDDMLAAIDHEFKKGDEIVSVAPAEFVRPSV